MENQETFRVVVADDHDAVRAGIVRELSRSGALEVVGQACTGNSLRVVLPGTPCDFLVLDLSMPGVGGMEALAEVAAFGRVSDRAVDAVTKISWPEPTRGRSSACA